MGGLFADYTLLVQEKLDCTPGLKSGLKPAYLLCAVSLQLVHSTGFCPGLKTIFLCTFSFVLPIRVPCYLSLLMLKKSSSPFN